MAQGPAEWLEGDCLRNDLEPVRDALCLAFREEICSWVQGSDHRTPMAGRWGGGSRVRGKAWEDLFGVLELVGLDSWVWSRLLSECGWLVDTLPTALAGRLRKRHVEVLTGNMILLDAMDEFIHLARTRDLPILPLKGAAMMSEPLNIYGDPGGRRMSDLDLFCPLERLDEASALARQLGYKVTETPLDARGLGHHRYFRKNYGAWSGGTRADRTQIGVTLELHYRLTVWWWRLGSLDRIAREQMSRRGQWRHDGNAARGDDDSIELHLILLCLHFLKHGMGPDLRNVVDLVELARRHRVDWLTLRDLAARAGVWGTVSFILSWIQDTILAPAGVEGPWVGTGVIPAESSMPLLGRFISRNKIPPSPVLSLPWHEGRLRWPRIDRATSRTFFLLALLPGLDAKGACLAWWIWDRWNLRSLLSRNSE